MGSLLFYADLIMAFPYCWDVVGVYCIGEKSDSGGSCFGSAEKRHGFMAEHLSIEQG